VIVYASSPATTCDADVDGDGSLSEDDLDALIEAIYGL
jgi:hypothetical protein